MSPENGTKGKVNLEVGLAKCEPYNQGCTYINPWQIPREDTSSSLSHRVIIGLCLELYYPWKTKM